MRVSVSNEITWWKDRDTWLPGGDAPPPHHDGTEQQEMPTEDAGDVADDDSDDLDDLAVPSRGPDH